jgi:hypothetical protein
MSVKCENSVSSRSSLLSSVGQYKFYGMLERKVAVFRSTQHPCRLTANDRTVGTATKTES